jgi:hypothetical protein
MTSLKVKGGSKKEVKNGSVSIEGSCVVLRELNSKTGDMRLVYAYCLLPGEIITGTGDDYIVEF